jgi:hypothetical protein
LFGLSAVSIATAKDTQGLEASADLLGRAEKSVTGKKVDERREDDRDRKTNQRGPQFSRTAFTGLQHDFPDSTVIELADVTPRVDGTFLQITELGRVIVTMPLN